MTESLPERLVVTEVEGVRSLPRKPVSHTSSWTEAGNGSVTLFSPERLGRQGLRRLELAEWQAAGDRGRTPLVSPPTLLLLCLGAWSLWLEGSPEGQLDS